MKHDNLRVRFLSNMPQSVMYGGFENRCNQTIAGLQEQGVDARQLEWGNKDDTHDILHLFGAAASWYSIQKYMKIDTKLVVSAIAGASGMHKLNVNVNRVFNALASLVPGGRVRTAYGMIYELLQRADCVLCNNELEKKYYINAFSLDAECVHILHNGIADIFYNAEGSIFAEANSISNYVLYVGRITSVKNPIALLRAVNQLDYPAVFIGDIMTGEESYAQQFSELINASPNTRWIRKLDYGSGMLASAFSAARVFCLPSRLETQPHVALEAMASGRPVILGDFPYAMQPPFEKCIRVNPNDAKALEETLRRSYEQESVSVPLPKDYLWSSVAKRLLEIYESL